MINVSDYAKGDGIADDTLAVQFAMAQAQAEAAARDGCELVFPAGEYKLSDEIRNTTHRVWIVGKEGARVRQTNAAKHVFHFDYPEAPPTLTGGGIVGLTVEAGDGWSRGFAGDGTDGAAVLARNVNDNFHIGDFDFTNCGTAIALLNCWNPVIDRGRALFCKFAGMLYNTDALGRIGGGSKVSSLKISNFGYTGTGASPLGLDLRASGGEDFTTLDITKFYNAVKICPASGSQVLHCRFINTKADTSLSDGYLLDSTNGKVWVQRVSAGWAAYNAGCGLRLRGPDTDGIKWEGELRENGQHGAWIEQAKRASIIGSDISSNGTLQANVYSGIHTGGNAGIVACNNTIGNFASPLSTQKYGIQGPSGGGPYPGILNNTFESNLSGEMSL